MIIVLVKKWLKPFYVLLLIFHMLYPSKAIISYIVSYYVDILYQDIGTWLMRSSLAQIV
jgi:hypothetical protein